MSQVNTPSKDSDTHWVPSERSASALFKWTEKTSGLRAKTLADSGSHWSVFLCFYHAAVELV